jgi:DNA phosphorothioation-associated putative methyltransferase
MDFYTDRGRLPAAEELGTEALGPLQSEFGSIRRAFKVILQATDAGEWDAIADKRRNDLLVYLALSHFGKRPKFKDLSPSVQADVKALIRQLPASLYRCRPDVDEPGANLAD